jgi:regulatory protein
LKIDSAKKAREFSFLLLKFRPRSAEEIRQRLRQKNFSPQVIRETLDFLKERRFIDDAAFAQGWAADRLKRPFGPRRIRLELRQKGVSPRIIEESLSQAQAGYLEEKIVREIAEAKFARLKGVEPEKARRRLYGFLLRRGFSPEVVLEEINRLIAV